MPSETIELSGHTIGVYCGPNSIRHLVREICPTCGAIPNQTCRRNLPAPPIKQNHGRWRIMKWFFRNRN